MQKKANEKNNNQKCVQQEYETTVKKISKFCFKLGQQA